MRSPCRANDSVVSLLVDRKPLYDGCSSVRHARLHCARHPCRRSQHSTSGCWKTPSSCVNSIAIILLRPIYHRLFMISIVDTECGLQVVVCLDRHRRFLHVAHVDIDVSLAAAPSHHARSQIGAQLDSYCSCGVPIQPDLHHASQYTVCNNY